MYNSRNKLVCINSRDDYEVSLDLPRDAQQLRRLAVARHSSILSGVLLDTNQFCRFPVDIGSNFCHVFPNFFRNRTIFTYFL